MKLAKYSANLKKYNGWLAMTFEESCESRQPSINDYFDLNGSNNESQ